MLPPRQEVGSKALIEFHKKLSESRGDFFFFFNLPQLAARSSSGPSKLFLAHSFPPKCLHREWPSWEAHLPSEHQQRQSPGVAQGQSKVGPGLFWLLRLPAQEASYRPYCRVSVASSTSYTSGYPSWHGPSDSIRAVGTHSCLQLGVQGLS